jgi:hypothetical protein
MVGAALSVVIAEPSLWLLGSAGFLVRGGLLLLALPIWTLPSPVGITTLLGPAVVNTGRLEGPLLAIVVAGFLLVAGLCLAGLFAAAWIDAALFERFVADPETAELRAGRRLPEGWRRPIVALVAVELVALLPAMAAAAVSLGRIVQVVREEILLPGDLAVPLPLRAAAGAAWPLTLLAAALVLAEALNGVLSRRVLLRGLDGAEPGRPLGRRLGRRLLGAVATAVTGWLLAVAVVAPAMIAVLIAWAGARDAYLTGALIGLERVDAWVIAIGATLLFVAVWAGTLLLGGVVSALRAAFWTGSALAARGDWTRGGD